MTCPAPQPGYTPKSYINPSALRAYADCPALWGRGYLEGRRTPDVAYADLPPPPAKAPAGATPARKKAATKALKAYNKAMRPALGTATHAIGEALYLQKVPGAWHPPMAWLDLAVAWETRPGQIFLTGRQHLPAPETLAAAWCERLVMLEPIPGWHGAWPRLGGTPDLVTAHYQVGVSVGAAAGPFFHLYDYKTTLDFAYAKTAQELRDHDEQAAIYSLAVMQEHGLRELDCTWVYMRTEGAPASIAVHFTMTRKHAEERVRALAPRALELEALTASYLRAAPGFMGEGKRLAVINALDTDDSACDNFSGCVYHTDRGGPCRPKKQPKQGLGSALRALATKKTIKKGRTTAAKAQIRIATMAMTEAQTKKLAELRAAVEAAAPNKLPFAQLRDLAKLEKLEAEEGGAAEETEAEGEGEEAPEEKPAAKPAPEKPKAAAASKPAKIADGSITATVDGFAFAVPAGSATGKALAKAAKSLSAAAAAFEGEG